LKFWKLTNIWQDCLNSRSLGSPRPPRHKKDLNRISQEPIVDAK
jgi:hypothetical protein